ncbi:hypothetical protein [Pandoraea soli]
MNSWAAPRYIPAAIKFLADEIQYAKSFQRHSEGVPQPISVEKKTRLPNMRIDEIVACIAVH